MSTSKYKTLVEMIAEKKFADADKIVAEELSKKAIVTLNEHRKEYMPGVLTELSVPASDTDDDEENSD